MHGKFCAITVNSDTNVTLIGNNPDWLTQDLFSNIENGTYPGWILFAQVLTPKQAETFK